MLYPHPHEWLIVVSSSTGVVLFILLVVVAFRTLFSKEQTRWKRILSAIFLFLTFAAIAFVAYDLYQLDKGLTSNPVEKK